MLIGRGGLKKRWLDWSMHVRDRTLVIVVARLSQSHLQVPTLLVTV